jgi:hypothetical protein
MRMISVAVGAASAPDVVAIGVDAGPGVDTAPAARADFRVKLNVGNLPGTSNFAAVSTLSIRVPVCGTSGVYSVLSQL